VHFAQCAGQSSVARTLFAAFFATSVWHVCRIHAAAMNAISTAQPRNEAVSYHGAVSDFKRRLIETTLHEARGNRTHAARTLGLQRTYLLRLIRELQVAAPPPPTRNGRAPTGPQSPAPAAVPAGPPISATAALRAPVRAAQAPTSAAPARVAAPAFCPPARPPARAPARRSPRR
jgi:Bacterial regulatory protein, Fis family